MSKWWTWEWDRVGVEGDLVLTYTQIIRWRRGWVTLYKFVFEHEEDVQTEWRLYLPFNVSVSVQFTTTKV